jgi:DNA (cytosine-5)-methyltransferase 1
VGQFRSSFVYHFVVKRFAEFFAGIGLVRMGLEKSGWQCVFANDIDPKKLEMYAAEFKDANDHFVLGDIRAVNALELPEVELATASFPCTDLSLAGGRAGLAGEHSSALWPFLEVLHKIDQMRPPLVLLENVPGFLTSHQGADFKSALLALNRLGYAVDAFIVDALHFVPQSRPRLFVVGSYNPDLPCKVCERRTPRFFESEARPPALAKFILENGDINWNIRYLPPLPKEKHNLTSVLEDLPGDAPEWWSEERVVYLLNQMSPKHKLIAEKMIAGKEEQAGTVFRRVRNGKSMAELRTDGTAGCLRTPKGGSGRQILLVAGNGQRRARLLTPRECARLMGADDYNLNVPSNQALFGFGDAVCVPVIDWVARNYLNPAIEEAPTPAGALILR